MVEPRHNIASISTKPSSIGTLAGVLDVCECRKQHKWITNGQTASIMVQKNTMANQHKSTAVFPADILQFPGIAHWGNARVVLSLLQDLGPGSPLDRDDCLAWYMALI